eukprot:TRINITY_DN15585_c0_g1_i2.p1 TRINITY_DN15585_c0_g1~~TRINITY_DN15585_c0_g1_i2.p1  ORF type:complete len:266 (+),score=57.59 TRINITY_DN15585_c0_g1_i2:98-895(+)
MGDIFSKCPGGSCEAVGVPPPVEAAMTFVHGIDLAPATAEAAAKTVERSPTPPRQRHSSMPPARDLNSDLRPETQAQCAPSATPPRCTDGDRNLFPTQEPGKAARGGQHQETCVVLSPPMQLWPPAAVAQRERALAAEQALQARRRQRAAGGSVHRAMRRRPIPCSAPAHRPRDLPKEDPHPTVTDSNRAGAKITFSDHTDERDYDKQVRGPAQQGCPAPKALKSASGEQRHDNKGLGLRMRWDSHNSRVALREMNPNDRVGHSS